MTTAAPIILSFSSGELSPLFDARIDLEEYQSGCKQIENMITLLEGPAERRGGTRFVREVKDSSVKCGSLRFEFNVEQAYFLEIGDQYIRFYTDHGVVLNGSSPLEVATPWVKADLFDADGNFMLRSVQSGDVLYITHTSEKYPVYKLSRTSALVWALDEMSPSGGPFEDLDPDETVTMYASGNTGTVTITASAGSTFNASHVGAMVYLEQKSTDTTLAWESGKAITANDIRRVDTRNYQAVNGATTGSIQPAHTSGAVYDGNSGVQWTFLDPGYGWATITAVASGGASCTATVESRIPGGAVGSGNATTKWAFGAWSDDLGWPSHVTFFRERLVFARASTRQIWFSQAGDFENFASKDDGGEVVKDAAASIEVTSDQVNRIEWISPSTNALLVGTAGGEFGINEITSTEAFGPGNIKSDAQSSYGSRPVSTVRVGESILFVQRSGRKMRDIYYTLEIEGFKSTNLTVLARHLFKSGTAITKMAYQQEPNSVIWATRSDGALLGTTLNINQRKFGWHRHPIGGSGVVEALESIPNPSADADEIWMIVSRTVNGSTVRYVEYMEPAIGDDVDIIEAFYVDSGLTYDGSVAATLTPGAGATVAGTTDVVFTAGSSQFVSGDVGKEIRYRYQDADDVYHTARAEITEYTSVTAVKATIVSAFPSTDVIASGGWAMTATTISGLDHLEGEAVSYLADGSPGTATVASGAITLPTPAWYVHVGLSCPAKIRSMRIEAGAMNGTAQGKTKRISSCVVRLHNTVGGKIGPSEGKLDRLLFRKPSDLMDEPLQMYSGDKDIAWPEGSVKDAHVMYMNDQPLPATVSGFMPIIETQAR